MCSRPLTALPPAPQLVVRCALAESRRSVGQTLARKSAQVFAVWLLQPLGRAHKEFLTVASPGFPAYRSILSGPVAAHTFLNATAHLIFPSPAPAALETRRCFG